MVFSIIRRKFWDYGRLALVTDEGSVHGFQCAILSRIVKDENDLFLNYLLCVSGSQSQHTDAMDTSHP